MAAPPQVTAGLAAKPDGVLPIGIATQLVPVVRELHTRNYKGQVFGISDLGGVVSTGNANGASCAGSALV
ncbi:MAG TPA: hypothetical protein VKY24_18895 [Reyranella sp.]|nr:hypothetical protein [Reyranella sp.]